MLRVLIPLVLAICLVLPAQAQQGAAVEKLFDALGLPDILDIMREEGVRYGIDIETDLFDGRGGDRWAATVEELYNIDAMTAIVLGRMQAELAEADVDAMLTFFSGEIGARIVGLEVSARRAMLDEAIDAASREAYRQLEQDKDPRLDLIRAYVEANDLVENNVVGAMNSNFAFYAGLADGGAFPEDLTEEEILTDVWSQEEIIREDTSEWVFSYLSLAYKPLSESDLQAYVAFSETQAGTALNRALFVSFDEMFVAQSLALGLSAADFMSEQDL